MLFHMLVVAVRPCSRFVQQGILVSAGSNVQAITRGELERGKSTVLGGWGRLTIANLDRGLSLAPNSVPFLRHSYAIRVEMF